MLRSLLGSMTVLLLCGVVATAQTAAQQGKGVGGMRHMGTISKVDKTNKTITVKMLDRSGKEVEKKFNLTDQVRMLDSNGRMATIDTFQSGDDVLLLEAQGQLKAIQKKPTRLPGRPVPPKKPGQ